MPAKHFFPSTDGLVNKGLQGALSWSPHLSTIIADKVILNNQHDPTKVSVISGGGAGHEPAHAGYTGRGMLTVAVSGEVFASPRKQIETAIACVPSEQGTILIITNYTGDMLHFGLAAEKVNASGRTRVGKIVVGDDVAVGRKGGGLVGRRGLAGTIAVGKITGAAAGEGLSFEDVLKIGQATSANLVTIAVGLDHCHVPGREEYAEGSMSGSECEIGMGLHNEPGHRKISPIPPAAELVQMLLKYLLDPNDEDRAYVPFHPEDEVLLLINNMGGTSTLEMGAFTQEVLSGLESSYSIKPSRVVAGSLMTSLNGPGASITLLNLTKAASECDKTPKDILRFLDAPTDAVAWPKYSAGAVTKDQYIEITKAEDEFNLRPGEDVQIDPSVLERKLRQACQNMIQSEPKLTVWDTEMGDGDCGETVANGAKGLLKALDAGIAKTGSILVLLHGLLEIVEDNMGGTLGAIFGIFLSSFLSSLRSRTTPSTTPIPEILATAASEALLNLQGYTPARVGDRTVLDVLIPFIEVLAKTKGDLDASADAAQIAARGTEKLAPKLGRATYVGLEEGQTLPPDPGAWALWEIVRGLTSG